MIAEEPMTLGERYATAVKSSHLEVVTRKRGDIDYIAAAGGAARKVAEKDGHDIAGRLQRLLQEYDQARGEARLAEHNNACAQLTAKAAAKRGAKAAAAAMRDAAFVAAMQARAHIRLKLHSLTETKEAFGLWAHEQAVHTHFMAPGPVPVDLAAVKVWRERVLRREKVVRAIAGRVLDIMLDPKCAHCEGRGFNGGYDGQPQTFICKHCVMGNRKVGSEEEGEEFAKRLQVQVEIMVGRFRTEMRDLLR